jgi:hypothetical protein
MLNQLLKSRTYLKNEGSTELAEVRIEIEYQRLENVSTKT